MGMRTRQLDQLCPSQVARITDIQRERIKRSGHNEGAHVPRDGRGKFGEAALF
jgi:hypothetical protein